MVFMPVHASAMASIKKSVTKAPELRHLDDHEEVTLQTDTSNTGQVAALLQNGQSIGYANRSLTETKHRYAQTKKELLSIMFGLEQFDQHTYGRLVKVETDHKPLETIYIQSSKQH